MKTIATAGAPLRPRRHPRRDHPRDRTTCRGILAIRSNENPAHGGAAPCVQSRSLCRVMMGEASRRTLIVGARFSGSPGCPVVATIVIWSVMLPFRVPSFLLPCDRSVRAEVVPAGDCSKKKTAAATAIFKTQTKIHFIRQEACKTLKFNGQSPEPLTQGPHAWQARSQRHA